MTETERDVCERALIEFGAQMQLTIAMEECCELAVAVSHLLRGRLGDVVGALAGEVADVELVCQTLRIICEREGFDVDAIRAEKVERLRARLGAK